MKELKTELCSVQRSQQARIGQGLTFRFVSSNFARKLPKNATTYDHEYLRLER